MDVDLMTATRPAHPAPATLDERAHKMTVSARQNHEDHAITQVCERLRTVFGDRSRSEVDGVVTRVTESFATARIRDFVPLLVERMSRDELSHRFGPVRGLRR
ncbi:hypothetical protein ABH926_008711 [Catenulispora sp. GP43]|uniref:three-helix bundle dimerization domain-containing protein n=1 Tax=Catenulispora sp. GP43 TaxID=3156263 RepID=UPI003512C9AC